MGTEATWFARGHKNNVGLRLWLYRLAVIFQLFHPLSLVVTPKRATYALSRTLSRLLIALAY